jgi:hypothetical protein
MNVILAVLSLAIILLIIFIINKKTSSFTDKKTNLSNELYNQLHIFMTSNENTYINFVNTYGSRNPLLYFELYQLYRLNSNKEVTVKDYEVILSKLSR